MHPQRKLLLWLNGLGGTAVLASYSLGLGSDAPAAVGWLYALVLAPSALWLPLTAHLLAHPSAAAWWAVRTTLALVALGSSGLLASLAALSSDAPRGRLLASVGLVPFCFQTVLLDALVWPAYFPVPTH